MLDNEIIETISIEEQATNYWEKALQSIGSLTSFGIQLSSTLVDDVRTKDKICKQPLTSNQYFEKISSKQNSKIRKQNFDIKQAWPNVTRKLILKDFETLKIC